jgi:hypothetical protein
MLSAVNWQVEVLNKVVRAEIRVLPQKLKTHLCEQVRVLLRLALRACVNLSSGILKTSCAFAENGFYSAHNTSRVKSVAKAIYSLRQTEFRACIFRADLFMYHICFEHLTIKKRESRTPPH